MDIPLTLITRNPRQPRTEFDPAALDELTQSMDTHGQIQSILVEANPDGTYTLIAGERRTRAARALGWETIRADVRPHLNGTGDRTRLMEALIENVARADMHALDEAAAYQTLMDEFGMSMVEIGHALGKGPNGQQYVFNRLVLIRLDEEIQKLLRLGFTINPQVATALLTIPDPAARIKLAKELFHNKTPYKACIAAAQKLAAALTQDAPLPRASSPALAVARTRGTADPDEDPDAAARYNALAHTGHVPLWPKMRSAVQSACNRCVWHDAASAKVCRECPVVHVLETLLK